MSLTDPTLRHLYVELARLDLLIHRRLARAAAMQSADDTDAGALRPPNGSFLTMDAVQALLQQPFGETFDPAVVTRADPAVLPATDIYAAAVRQVEQQIAEVVEEPSADGGSRLAQLALACDLSRFELEALLICLAPALDLRYERIYGFLHDDLTRRRATPNLILDLLSAPGPERLRDLVHLGDDGPLLRLHLLERVAEPGIIQPVLLNQALAPEPSIVLWLLGRYSPGHLLQPYVEVLPAVQPDAAHFGPAQMLAMEQAADGDAFVVLTGKDAAAKRYAVAWFAGALGAPLLSLDLHAVTRAGADAEEILGIFLRDALLTGSVAAMVGLDTLLEDGAPPPPLFAMLCDHPGPVAIASDSVWRPRDVDRARRLTWIDFPPSTYVQRRNFLSATLAELPSDEPLDAAALSGRFVLTTRQMTDMVASALDHAAQAGRLLTNEDLFTAAREHSSPRLTTFARKLSARYDWDDLVLPDDQLARLRELLLTVRGRPQVLDEWGYGRKLAPSYGVAALFAGPPGTGKTMAAEVLARTLGLDVYKIDLSGMISKYIGETEKNLERIFTEAENSNAILFFDEADAVFGKRSEVKDAHDRYANIETSYLLQRMEAYDGVTILATNLRANLDEAFTRRLHSVVDFPFPDAAERLRIWLALFPSNTPCAGDVDLPSLARRFKISGGSIRNVIVAAAYYAVADKGIVGMGHLLHATRRELQKLGRLTDEKDFVA